MANLSNINNKFLVTTGGNVLIGQTGAIGSSLLQVNGIIGVGSSNQTTLNQTSTHFFMDMTSSTSYFRNTSTAGSGFIFRNSNIGDFEFDNEFAGNIKFNTSNVEAMRIDSSGDTHLQGNLFFEGSTSYVAGYSIRRQGANFIFTGGTTGTFFNRNGNGATDMYIDASGFVGIGATVPTNQLHVHTDTDDAYGIRIEGSTNNVAGVWTGLGIGGENANTKSALLFEDTVGSYARGKLHLCVNNGADQTSATPADAKLTITPAGDVGIGTAAPGELLEVMKDGGAIIRMHDPGNNSWRLKADTDFHIYDDSLSDYLTIKNSGKVGIGYTSPGSQLSIYKTAFGGDTAGSGGTLDFGVGSTKYWQFRLDSSSSGDLAIDKTYANVWTTPITIQRSSGNVGIGVTPNAPANGLIQLDIGDNGCGMTSRQNNELILQANANYSTYAQAGVPATRLNLTNSGEFHFLNAPAGTAIGDTITFTERMRITNAGDVLFGTTSATSYPTLNNFIHINEVSGVSIVIGGHSGTHTAVQFRHNGATAVGSIVITASSTSYNTSSDYRLKENVIEMTGALDRVSQLKPSRFNFIIDPNKTVDGFLAHEVHNIVPEAISGKKDAVDEDGNPEYQGIDQSKLVPLLVAAIQELKAEIELLKSK